MTGFKNEAQLWSWMIMRMKGKWERIETIFPVGVPDCFGTHNGEFQWIERKVGSGDVAAMLESSQKDFFKWMHASASHMPLWVAVGSPTDKSVKFYRYPDLAHPVLPPWWTA